MKTTRNIVAEAGQDWLLKKSRALEPEPSCEASMTAATPFFPPRGRRRNRAQDWTQMLYRMYTRYCDRLGFTCTPGFLDGVEAGVKSVTLRCRG